MPSLAEETLFEPDSETMNPAKNTKLAVLLQGPWNFLAIVRVERIENGTDKGWLVTYRG